MNEPGQKTVLIEYRHPFRLLYAFFWFGLAGLCGWFLFSRPDAILWTGLAAGGAGGLVTLISRQEIFLLDGQLYSVVNPPLWRRARSWPLVDVLNVLLEASLALEDREITRPLHYSVQIHEASGRFRPLIVVHEEAIARRLAAAIRAAVESAREQQ